MAAGGGCWLHRIKSVRGAALMVESQVSLNTDGSVASGKDNTATSCAVTMDNVQIFQCHVTEMTPDSPGV